MIKVKFYGVLKKNMPQVEEDGFWHIEDEEITIEEVLKRGGADNVSFGMTLLVNRVRKDRSYVLKDGDTLTVMPLIAGG